MIERISPAGQRLSEAALAGGRTEGQTGRFDALLREAEARRALEEKSGLTFSKHAMSRVQERGIEVTPALMERLTDTVERARAKGTTNILAFDSARAFIINVPHATVITAISQEELQENIFTNIDGAAVL